MRFRGQEGSAVVDFILTSFGLLAIFTSALTVITNLYLKTVLTNVATNSARQLARADQSSNPETAIVAARNAINAIVGDHLQTEVSAKTLRDESYSSAVVTVNAKLPGFILLPNLTAISTSAHATLELQ